ncbi:MAG: hypothetical protein Q8K82_00775 [Gemmatimonadaceae bacterium]|nr:hypothetical protein [Gemmatimonadaceae bacterium]
MKVLLDECVPRRFRDALSGIAVSTARDQRWTILRNGELVAEMRAAGFTTLVTVDRNLTFQQQTSVVAVKGRKRRPTVSVTSRWSLRSSRT